ncbi:MAG: peptide deformylase, partial [bacterium]|nr:peptide deformylase [bacterium]
MTARPVLTNPNNELRHKAADIEVSEIVGKRIQTLIDDMMETMVIENGIGIAAPQVGVRDRVLIVDAGDNKPMAVINPRITSKSFRKIEFEEGCLSIPGVFGMVKRHKDVTVEAYNRDGEEVTIKASGLLSVVLQHEIDH